MLNNKICLVIAAAVAAVALTACGGGGSNGTASVRLVNSTSTHPALTMLSSGTTVITATPIDTVSSYAGVSAGSPPLQVNDAVTGTALATLAPSVGAGAHYVLVAYESGGIVRSTIVNEDTAVPAVGTASLRVLDGATDAGAVDVYVTDPAVDIGVLASPSFTFPSSPSLQTSAFVSLSPGTYRIRVTGAGNPADLRLDVPSFPLASQEVAAVLLTPTIGGTLVNGAVLAQQAAYTAGRNTTARVRLAAAVSGNAIVSASAANTPVAASVVSPSVSAYAVVPAGSALNVSVNGGSVAAPAAPLLAGSDSTLLVYGAPGTATASLIADDNHLPTLASNLKLRMINGLTGAATPLTLNAGFAVLASNVAPGTASSYSVVASSTALRIDVFSPLSPTAIYSDPALSIPGNAVYTLFMLGDAGAPLHILRKDR